MNKKIAFVVGLLCCSMIGGTALAAEKNIGELHQDTRQVYKAENLLNVAENNVAGGRGTVEGKMAFVREDATEDDAIKEMGICSLKRGDYIGMHAANSCEEAYLILSGTGLYTNGKTETIVTKGDVLMARVGQSHGLRNIGYEPLNFVTVLAKNEGNAATWNVENIDNNKRIRDYRGEVAIQRDNERQIEQKRAIEQQKLTDKERKLAEKQAQREAKEKAKLEKQRLKQEEKARKEAAKKQKAGIQINENANAVTTPVNAVTTPEAKKDVKKNVGANDSSHDAAVKAARAEDAAWQEAQKAKIQQQNSTELDDEFAIGA